MIKRYMTESMRSIWSETNKFRIMWDVEKAYLAAMYDSGLIPTSNYFQIVNANIKWDEVAVQYIEDAEKITKHDVLAFLKYVEHHIGENSKFVHNGLTSSDVLDTATVLLINQSVEQLITNANELKEIIEEFANSVKGIETVGRTHGMHAELMPFSFKPANWYGYVDRAVNGLMNFRKSNIYGQMSGPVGNYSSVTPELESNALAELGLTPEPISTQVLPRDRFADYVYCAIKLVTALEVIALEIRHLSRTEVGELSEGFQHGQMGSSSMPHKKNPISSENITGISRLVRSYIVPSIENIPLWHERDISHSSVERNILPDISHAADYAAARATTLVKNLNVNREQIKKNVELTNGLIFSGQVLNKTQTKDRTDAYVRVQEAAIGAPEKFMETFGAYTDREAFLRHEEYVLSRVFKKS